jgi:hypothetical protein
LRFDLRTDTALRRNAEGALPLFVERGGHLVLVGAFVASPGENIACFADVDPWLSLLAGGGYNLFFTPQYTADGRLLYGVLSEVKATLTAIPVQVTF